MNIMTMNYIHIMMTKSLEMVATPAFIGILEVYIAKDTLNYWSKAISI
jgi:hypothetical protein